MNLLHMDSAGRKQERRLEAYRRCCHKRMIRLEVRRYTLGHLDNHLVVLLDIHRLLGFAGPSTVLLGLAGMGYLQYAACSAVAPCCATLCSHAAWSKVLVQI